MISASEPGGATAEAYRALRSAVLLMTPNKQTLDQMVNPWAGATPR